MTREVENSEIWIHSLIQRLFVGHNVMRTFVQRWILDFET
jgi:hypothetical protein